MYPDRKIVILFITHLLLNIYAEGKKPDLLFRSDELLKLEIRADFTSLQKSRTGEPAWVEGELIYYQTEGLPVKLNVRISVRGNFRLKPENCSFPPLLIDFRKESVKNTLFEDQNRLKLVTPCQNDADLLEEYIVYKLYNLITEYSFRVRLARILYFDISKNETLFERYSFFLEDEDRMAKRNNAEVTEKFVTPFDLDYDSYKKLSVFQFIIGNKDWYVVSRKNIVIIQPNDTTVKPVAVPYDFDFSGLVDAYYTYPKNLPGYTVGYRRSYKGICYTREELKEVFDYFRHLRPAIVRVVKNEKLIDAEERYRIVEYINYSISLLRSRSVLKSEFLGNCETKELYNLSSR